eukprot:Hpha_TRINITY_DN316_c0_g2::TRINITY_DN316_c0_g2_i1::g.112817::m.112817
MARLLAPPGGALLSVATPRATMVHGVLGDPYCVVWKPACLAVSTQEGDMQSSVLRQVTAAAPQPVEVPASLGREESGLQILVRSNAAHTFLRKALRMGLWRQGYAVLARLPRCLREQGVCRSRFAVDAPWEGGKLARRFRLRAVMESASRAQSSERVRPDMERMERFFRGGGDSCPRNTPDCASCRTESHPFLPAAALLRARPALPKERRYDHSLDMMASVVGVSTQQGAALLRVSVKDASSEWIRAALSSGGLPPVSDPAYDLEYAGVVKERAAEGSEPSGE